MKIKRFNEAIDDPFNEETFESEPKEIKFRVGQRVRYKRGKGSPLFIGTIIKLQGKFIEVRWYMNNKVVVQHGNPRMEDIELVESDPGVKSRTVYRLDIEGYEDNEFIGFFSKRKDAEAVLKKYKDNASANGDVVESEIRKVEVPQNTLVFEPGEFQKFRDEYERMSKKQKRVVSLLSQYSDDQESIDEEDMDFWD